MFFSILKQSSSDSRIAHTDTRNKLMVSFRLCSYSFKGSPDRRRTLQPICRWRREWQREKGSIHWESRPVAQLLANLWLRYPDSSYLQ